MPTTTRHRVAIDFLGSTAELEAALKRAGLVAEEEGGKISGAFQSASDKTSGIFGKLGNTLSNWGLPFGESISAIGEKFKDVEAEGKSFTGVMSEVGKATLLGGGAAFAAAAGEGVKLAMTYQQTTAGIQASAGISEKAASRISNAFLNTAGSTTFSAQEIASAYASVAGQLKTTEGHALSAKESLAFMQAAQDAAEASGESLGSTTSALATIMQSYHLRVSEAATTSDQLYNISRATGVSISSLATPLGMMHARLGALMPSLSDTGTLVVALASHGLTGSRGIQAASTAFGTLLGGSKSVAKELGALGVKVTDQNGNFVGMASVISQLQPAISALGTAQQEAALKTLFGSTMAQTMGSIIAGGPAKYDAYSKAVEKTGTAQAGAEAHAKTLSGQIETLKSAGEDLATKLGNALIPKVTELMGDVSHSVTWFEKHKTVAKALAAVIGGVLAVAVGTFAVQKIGGMIQAVGDAGQAFLGLIAKIPGLSAAFGETGTAAEAMGTETEAAATEADAAIGSTGLGLVVIGLGIAAGLLMTHWKTVWNAISSAVKWAWDEVKGHWQEMLLFLGPIGLAIDLLAKNWKTVWNGVRDTFLSVWNAVKGPLGDLGKLVSGVGGFLGKLFGGGGSKPGISGPVTKVGYRANGGDVTAGMPFIVGEQGPELFVPAVGGQIVPNVRAVAAHPVMPSVAPIPGARSLSNSPTYNLTLVGTPEQLVGQLKAILADHTAELASLVEAS